MKKTLTVIALSTMLAAPALAEETATGGLNMKMKGIDLNFGGFIEAASVYRAKNQNSDLATGYTGLPLANSPSYNQEETRFSARQSRLSILAKGDYNSSTHLAGYYEMDFLGAAGTANQKESNSYNPRIRHLYTTADWDSMGLHLLAGQTWSLTTLNNKGITPRNEVTPLGIEAQYVPGFTWARQPQFRIVKDFDKTLWLALSVENPQTAVAGSSSAGANYTINQGTATKGNMGDVLSVNSYPDVVVKASFDPSWGHFEIYDLIRTFQSDAYLTATPNVVNSTKTTTNAIGGGAILPIVPKQLTLTLSGLYGKGIGRYGSAQLPDVTYDASGNLIPVKGYQLLAGLIYDPTSDWNFYTYYGQENVDKTGTDGATKSGYGSEAVIDNSGAGTLGGTVGGNVQRVSQGTVGTWWKCYQGSAGKMQAGLQYSYTENKYFNVTKGGAPLATNNIFFTSLRYYWN